MPVEKPESDRNDRVHDSNEDEYPISSPSGIIRLWSIVYLPIRGQLIYSQHGKKAWANLKIFGTYSHAFVGAKASRTWRQPAEESSLKKLCIIAHTCCNRLEVALQRLQNEFHHLSSTAENIMTTPAFTAALQLKHPTGARHEQALRPPPHHQRC